MEHDELVRRINIDLALNILSWKTGKYTAKCEAYRRKKINDVWVWACPDLKYDFDSEMMPLLEAICGNRLGDNPNLPDHPIRTWKA